MSRTPVLKPREVCRILDSLGFSLARQRGSHMQYRHPDGRCTTVPNHPGRDVSWGDSDPKVLELAYRYYNAPDDSFVVLGFRVVVGPASSKPDSEDVHPPSFARLRDALKFIDHKLDTDNWHGVAKALYPPLESENYLTDPRQAYHGCWQPIKDERGNLRLTHINRLLFRSI